MADNDQFPPLPHLVSLVKTTMLSLMKTETPGRSNSKPHSKPAVNAVQLPAHVVDDDARNNLNIFLIDKLTINVVHVVWHLSLRSAATYSSPPMQVDPLTPHTDASQVNLYFLFELRVQNPNHGCVYPVTGFSECPTTRGAVWRIARGHAFSYFAATSTCRIFGHRHLQVQDSSRHSYPQVSLLDSSPTTGPETVDVADVMETST
jgi:hypothetical protein